MLNNTLEIDKNNLLNEVAALKDLDFRLITLTCEKADDKYELIYHFDKDYTIKNIKIIINKDDAIRSISIIYPCAFLIENEYQDLFGIKFDGLTIDYKGRLYLTEDGPIAPLR